LNYEGALPGRNTIVGRIRKQQRCLAGPLEISTISLSGTLKDERLKSDENTEVELQVTNPVCIQRDKVTDSEKSSKK